MLNATQPPRRMRFSFESRCRVVSLVLAGQSPQAAAAACGASRATGYRLRRRYQEGGWSALADRPPVPKHQPRRLSLELEQRILAAREYAKAGPLIVAGQLGLPASTVSKVLRRYGVSRLPRPSRGPGRPTHSFRSSVSLRSGRPIRLTNRRPTTTSLSRWSAFGATSESKSSGDNREHWRKRGVASVESPPVVS